MLQPGRLKPIWWMLRKANREISKAQTETLAVLVHAVAAEAGDDLCRNMERGSRIFAARLRERCSADVLPKIERLEAAVVSRAATEKRFNPFIQAARNLFVEGSPEPARLLQEVCLALAISGERSLPWVRRR